MRRTLRLLTLAALLLVLLPPARAAHAANRVVTTTANAGPGSLRQALTDAVSGDTITFSIPDGSTINLTSVLPSPAGGVTIDAVRNGRPQIVLNGSAISSAYGLFVTTANNTIRGLVINNFGGSLAAGIILSGPGATGNTISTNYIGTNYAGDTAVANQYGVAIQRGASNNVVDGNLLSGNLIAGVLIAPTSNSLYSAPPGATVYQDNNVVRNNTIGPRAGGTQALGVNSQTYGVYVLNNARNTTIGPGNVISANGGTDDVLNKDAGVRIDANEFGVGYPTPAEAPSGTLVRGNLIGTTADGNSALANRPNGVFLGASVNTTVGGVSDTDAAQRNVISGNSGAGVHIEETFTNKTISGMVIRNNMLGVNAGGTAAITSGSNGGGGVYLTQRASNVTIGPGNTIAANVGPGVYALGIRGTGSSTTAADAISGLVITGNRIGTNATGSAAIANQLQGVMLRGAVTGATVSDNRIAGNNSGGITIDRSTLTSLVPLSISVTGNQIGGLSSGAAPGNGATGADGVAVYVGSGHVIGPGNVILGHSRSGVALDGNIRTDFAAPTGIAVRGNQIGPVSGGGGNTYGIYMARTTANTIGSSSGGAGGCTSGPVGECNLVSRNTQTGIRIENGATDNRIQNDHLAGNGDAGVRVTAASNNRISRTTTSGNTQGGIRLSTGGNNSAPAQVTSATASGTSVSGALTCPGGNCTVQVFGDSAPLTNEGPVFLGEAAGVGTSFSLTISPCRTNLIFTATDSSGNTSFFHNPITTSCPPPASATLSAAVPNPSQTAAPGASVTFRHTLTNSGSSSGTFDVSASSSPNWPTTVQAGSGALPRTLAVGESVDVNVTVTIPAGTPPNTSATVTVTPIVDGAPATAAARTNTATSASGPTPLLELASGETASKSGAAGTSVSYSLVLRNTGGTDGTFSVALSGTPPVGWGASVTPSGSVNVPAGGQVALTLSVSVAAGAQVGTSAVLSVTATSGSSSSSLQTTTGVTFTPVAPSVALTSASPVSVGPGQPASFTFSVTNNSNGTDGVTVSVTPPSGWSSSVTPPSPLTALAAGASRSFTVQVTSPTGLLPGTYNGSVTVCAQTAPAPCAAPTAFQVQVIAAAVPRLTAGTAPAPADPNTDIALSATLANVGNSNGSFANVATPPSGWTLVTAPAATSSVNQGTSTGLSYTVRAPAGTLAGNYDVALRSTAQDSNAASTTLTQTVTINKVPNLSLTPPTTSGTQPPNTVFTTTFTLTNSGNFPDTIALTASNSVASWQTRIVSNSVRLNPGQSTSVQVVTRIPPGQSTSVSNITTVTATYGSLGAGAPGRSVSATITTGIQPATGALLGPPILTKTALVTQTVSYTFVLTNSGSVDQSYDLALENVPSAGWQASITSTTTVGPLTPGAAVSVQVSLRAAPGTPQLQPNNITLRATSQPVSGLSASSATAIARLIVGLPFSVTITPNNVLSSLPGTVARFQHIVTNTGLNTDTITLNASSLLGWELLPVAPSTLTLGSGQSQTIEVVVLVPATLDAGIQDVVTVNARSTGNPNQVARATETVTIRQIAAVGVAPSRSATLAPSTTLTFDHTVTNFGNGADSFVIGVLQDLDWSVTLSITTTPTLAVGGSFPVRVTAVIPANADPRATNNIRVIAVSRYDATKSGQVVDVIAPRVVQSGFDRRVFLPLINR